MINLDEIVERNKNRDFKPETTSYAETHVTPTPKTSTEYTAASVSKRAKRIGTRGVLLLVLLAVAGIGSVVAFSPVTNPQSPLAPKTTTPTDLRLTVEYAQFNSTAVVLQLRAVRETNLTSYTAQGQTHPLNILILSNGMAHVTILGTFQVGQSYQITLTSKAGYNQGQSVYTVTYTQ